MPSFYISPKPSTLFLTGFFWEKKASVQQGKDLWWVVDEALADRLGYKGSSNGVTSNWQPVVGSCRAAFQGLFNLFISGLDEGLEGTLGKT